MIDNRSEIITEDKVAFAIKWCDRRFGIGSDGVIFIESHPKYDFKMDFYNPDGSQSFCGNGSRCAMAYAKNLGMILDEATFEAIDGIHVGRFTDKGVSVKMGNVHGIELIGEDHFIDTGSPHYISYEIGNRRDILEFGKEIRYSDRFKAEGTNVNLVQLDGQDAISVSTYERGVENETFACGTGATACGLSLGFKNELSEGPVQVKVKGGELTIHFKRNGMDFEDVWLEGPAVFVFKGKIDE